MKNCIFLILFFSLSCTKTDIKIGLEGIYDVEVEVIKRSRVFSVHTGDSIHGLNIAGDSAACWGTKEFSYIGEITIFKQQGKYYLGSSSHNYEIPVENNILLELEKGVIKYTSPEGSRVNGGNSLFKISLDRSTLRGSWILGSICSQGSIGSIGNGILEQANIKLVKK